MARLACESVMARNSHDPATVPEGPWLRFWVPGKLGFHCLRLTAVCKMGPQALGGAVFVFPFSPSLMSKSSSLSRQNKWFRDRNSSFMFCFRLYNLPDLRLLHLCLPSAVPCIELSGRFMSVWQANYRSYTLSPKFHLLRWPALYEATPVAIVSTFGNIPPPFKHVLEPFSVKIVPKTSLLLFKFPVLNP